MKKLALIIISVVLACCVTVAANGTSAYIFSAVPEPTVSSTGGEWSVIAAARGSFEVPNGYFDKYYENVKAFLRENGGVLSSRKYTEYSRVVLALTAIGRNPEDVQGYNLVLPLTDYDAVIRQGINGAIWALIALNSGNYSADAVHDKYTEKILSAQNPDGGWAISEGGASDIDITAMAVCALFPDKSVTVQNAVKSALVFLDGAQPASSESLAQIIIAKCTAGITPTETEQLMQYKTPEGGFSHVMGGAANLMATEQAFCALAALSRFESGKTPLYEMSNTLKIFYDVENHSAKEQIYALASKGIINGKTPYVFDPDGTMTRAEFAAIVTRALGISEKGKDCFSDVLKDDWFYGCVYTAYSHGIINGVSKTEFNPGGIITAEEAAVMLCRAYKKDTSAPGDETVSSWARGAYSYCEKNGIFPEGIMPKNTVTRAQIAVMLYNISK